MAYDPGAIDSTLAAIAGDDPILMAELRTAFIQSAHNALDAIDAAQGDEAWRGAAERLKGLAASFGAVRLMAIADEAIQSPAGEVRVLQRLKRAVARF